MSAAGAPGGRIPLVGLTTYAGDASWGPWHRPAAVLHASYVALVARAGCRPLLVPPCADDGQGGAAGAAEVVAALDALVLVGGNDLHPGAYGASPHPTVTGVDPVRDRAEMALLQAALDADLPVLAVCRGLQVLNVTLGGTLVQHLPDTAGHHGHQPALGEFADVDVRTLPGSAVAAIMGPGATVRCSHHQAVDRLGAGLVVAAWSLEQDPRVIEAIELPGHRFVVGVQWHPEEAADRRLFDALVAAAAGRQPPPAGPDPAPVGRG